MACLAERIGWYQSIIAADIDADGDQDLVVGNWGHNTKYHASNKQPALLYYGDFESSGRMHLVEAEFEDEKLFPVRGKSCSTNAMPFLGDKYKLFHDFASASLDEIYTQDCLASAHRFSANSLDSGVYVNEGGRFDFKPFPTLGQVAPVSDIAVGDFDKDGHQDVFLAENFYGPQPETGRADGGICQILLGNGDGTFRPLLARDSGIVVAGDATSVSQVDIDGDGAGEIIVTTNDGPVYTFKARQ